MNENKNSKKGLIERINLFYKSWLSLIIFIVIISLFSIIQIVLFGLGLIDFNYINVNDSNANIVWIALFFSITSSFAGFIGGIYLIRKDLKCFPWLGYQIIGLIIIYFITESWFQAIFLFVSFAILIIMFFNWKKEQSIENIKKSANKIWVSIFLISWSIIMILILIFVSFKGDEIYPDSKASWARYCDALIAMINILGIFFMIIKSRLAFVFYLISGLIGIAYFIESCQIILIVQMSLFSFIYISGWLSWTYEYNIKNIKE